MNDGVFSVKCKKAFVSIKDKHIGGLIRSDDDDRHTSVFGLLFTTVHRCGWAAPMETVLTRLKEEVGFEVVFLKAPRKPLLSVRDPSNMPTTRLQIMLSPWLIYRRSASSSYPPAYSSASPYSHIDHDNIVANTLWMNAKKDIDNNIDIGTDTDTE